MLRCGASWASRREGCSVPSSAMVATKQPDSVLTTSMPSVVSVQWWYSSPYCRMVMRLPSGWLTEKGPGSAGAARTVLMAKAIMAIVPMSFFMLIRYFLG